MRSLFIIALLVGASSAASIELPKLGTSASASAFASASASTSFGGFKDTKIGQLVGTGASASASASVSASASTRISLPCREVVETPCAEVVEIAAPCVEVTKVATPCVEVTKVATPCVRAPRVRARASASASASASFRRRVPCERRVRPPCTPTVIRRPCPPPVRTPCPQVITPCTSGCATVGCVQTPCVRTPCVRTPCVRRPAPQKIIRRRGCASARAGISNRRIAPRCFRPTADLLRGKELVSQMLTVGCMEWQCEPIEAEPTPEPCEVTILSDPAPSLPCGRIIERACDKVIA